MYLKYSHLGLFILLTVYVFSTNTFIFIKIYFYIYVNKLVRTHTGATLTRVLSKKKTTSQQNIIIKIHSYIF